MMVTPRWWYHRRAGPRALRPLLALAAAAWTWAGRRRLHRARPQRVDAPVICVGNLTLGGSGKTPVVQAVAARLAARGAAVHVLLRGHRGRLRGPVRVDLAAHDAAEVGDEALMLARGAPTWIARDRLAGASAAVAAGASVIVLDDGHQNPGLTKNLTLLVIDGETRDGEWPFGDGAVFPAGPLREPLAEGLARADAAIILLPADLEQADPALIATLASLPVLTARLQPTQKPPAGPQVGFAGVGKPWKVERALTAAGCQLVDFLPLADHAPLAEGLLKVLEARARALGAGLVTTEKDWVRLPPAWRSRVESWPVQAVFDDETALDRLLDRAF